MKRQASRLPATATNARRARALMFAPRLGRDGTQAATAATACGPALVGDTTLFRGGSMNSSAFSKVNMGQISLTAPPYGVLKR